MFLFVAEKQIIVIFALGNLPAGTAPSGRGDMPAEVPQAVICNAKIRYFGEKQTLVI